MGKKLYVGNLPFSTTEATLSEMFAQAGAVESVKIMLDRDTGRPRGYAFIEMATDEDAQSAITKFNGVELEGRAMTVNEARPMQPRTGGGGGFGGRGGGGGGRGDRGGFGGGGRGDRGGRPSRY